LTKIQINGLKQPEKKNFNTKKSGYCYPLSLKTSICSVLFNNELFAIITPLSSLIIGTGSQGENRCELQKE
jgi:hypothetical protein